MVFLQIHENPHIRADIMVMVHEMLIHLIIIEVYYIPEKVFGNIMFSSATQPPPQPRPPRHNFVVSAITFKDLNYVIQT